MTRVALAVLALSLCVSGCGQPDRYAEWKTYVAPGGEYRLRYLDPPWEVSASDGSTGRLVVENNASRFGDLDSSLAPKFELTVTLVSGGSARLAAAAAASAPARGEEVLVAPTPFTTRSEDVGVELVTRELRGELRYRRLLWIDRPGGATVQLQVLSVPEIRDPEVDAMLASVDVDPEGP